MWTPLVKSLWPPWWWHGPQEFYPSEVFFPFYALTNIPAAGFCYYWCCAAILRIWRHPRKCFNQTLAGCLYQSDLHQASGSFVSWNLSNTKSWLFHFATLCDTWECLCNFKYVIHGSVYATLYIMGMFIVYALLLCFHRPATQICPTWVRVCVLDNIFTMYETLFWSTRR